MERLEEEMCFTVTYGHHNHMKLTAYVKDGKVYKVETYIKHYNHGSASGKDYTPEDEMFKNYLREFINVLYQEDDIDYYKSFINSLDEETLEKYFEKFYIPK